MGLWSRARGERRSAEAGQERGPVRWCGRDPEAPEHRPLVMPAAASHAVSARTAHSSVRLGGQ
jgi:hypothetical protein